VVLVGTRVAGEAGISVDGEDRAHHPGLGPDPRSEVGQLLAGGDQVANIQAVYQEWRSKGAVFLTPPKDHGREIRCYMRDPDGHLIEVGQTTGALPDR
jgi:catechol 2,3-dioxygenase-like lactoylglutathione lyase family enzyme